MNILITGGLGYIGGRITDHLLKKKIHNITITTSQSKKKIPQIFMNVNVKKADILDQKRINEICEGMDTIIHLVAPNENVSAIDPQKAINVTVNGTSNVLEAARLQNVSKFIYFSTFHIYGVSSTDQSISESTLPKPNNPYSTSHLMAELLVNMYRYKYNIETIILRLSNIFGAPISTNVDRWTLLVNDLCYQAIKNGQLKLKSSGNQHRDFIPFIDALSALDLLMNKQYRELGDGVFNLGTGQSLTILDMCNKIKSAYLQEYKKEISIILPKTKKKETASPIKYDISKLMNLGFKPSYDYESEIINTLKICEQKVTEEKKNSF